MSSSDVLMAPIDGRDIDSSTALVANEADHWSDAIDTLLRWASEPDEISPECLESAIDFAVDLRDKASAPSSIMATEDGNIAFEWRAAGFLLIVTITGSGRGEYTMTRDCRVVAEGTLRRDPRTRKLQLASA